MYLGLLKNENKENFLDMILCLAKVDNDFSVDEQDLIKSYCDEMNIVYRADERCSSVEQLINEIDISASKQEKKIIIFEAIGLAMADGDFDGDERKIICLAAYVFGLDETYVNECESFLVKYFEFQNQVNQIVLGE